MYVMCVVPQVHELNNIPISQDVSGKFKQIWLIKKENILKR
jgi:hypothetical protein